MKTFLILALVSQVGFRHLYVDPKNGLDTNACTMDAPCQTPARAKAVIGSDPGLIHQAGQKTLFCHNSVCI